MEGYLSRKLFNIHGRRKNIDPTKNDKNWDF
jgi:hypothetical protein